MIATHIVWTTYGSWLSGDDRGWTHDATWQVQPPNATRQTSAQNLMVGDAVELTPAQRAIVEQTIRDHCRIRNWELHVGTRHVHIVASGGHTPRQMRDQFKAWCSRRLSDAAALSEKVAVAAGRKRWFTEGGDTAFIDDEQYLENAIRYVIEGQAKDHAPVSPPRQQGQHPTGRSTRP